MRSADMLDEMAGVEEWMRMRSVSVEVDEDVAAGRWREWST